MEMEFKLPPLGEGVDEVVVAAVPVKEGDSVAKGQTLLEVETNKAVMEIESLFSGTVSRIMIKAGDKARVGQVMMVFQGEGPAKAAAPADIPARPAAPVPKAPPPSAEPVHIFTPAPPPPPPAPAPAPAPKAAPAPREKEAPLLAPEEEPRVMDLLIPASPSVRKLARELGVDLQKVIGNGPGGRISEEDVRKYVKETMIRLREQEEAGPSGQITEGSPAFEDTRATGLPPAAPPALPKLPDFSEWGAVERRALNMVKRTGAKVLLNSWLQAPQVTHEDAADVTSLETARLLMRTGKRATMTAYLVKAVVEGLKTFPQFNSSYDPEFKELIQKTYYNIGIAVDTNYGLMVPVIRGAEKKTIEDIALELDSLAKKARDHRLSMEEMQGGCFSISNLGGIGGRAFSPIINWPEVAILGVARARNEFVDVGAHRDAPTQRQGEFRLMLPLCLTYDHRVIDGAEAARFMNKLRETLETSPFPVGL